MGLARVRQELERAREREKEEKEKEKEKEQSKKGASELAERAKPKPKGPPEQPQYNPLPQNPVGPPPQPVYNPLPSNPWQPPQSWEAPRDEDDNRNRQPYRLLPDEQPYQQPSMRQQVIDSQPEPIQNRIGNYIGDTFQQGVDAFQNWWQPDSTGQPYKLLPDEQPQSSQWRPQRTGFSDTSDIGRGPYYAPNRPIVPAQPRPFGQEQQSLMGNPIQDTVNNWNNVGGLDAILQDPALAAADWFTNTPAYQYAQEQTKDRRATTPPNLLESMMEGATAFGGGPIGTPAGMAVGGIVGALNQTNWGREAIIRGQDAMDRTFDVPGRILTTTPIPGLGASFSEYVTPSAVGLLKGMSKDQVAIYMAQEIAKSKDLRKTVEQLVAAGHPEANLALANLPSGFDAAQNTLNLLQNRDKMADELHAQAVAAQYTQPDQAGELFRQEQQLRAMTFADMVEANMDIWAEIGYGVFVDPSEILLAPIGLALRAARVLPESRALRKATRELDDVPLDVLIRRLNEAPIVGETVRAGVTEGPRQGVDAYQQAINAYQGIGEKVNTSAWTKWMLTHATPAAKAAADTRALSQGIFGMLTDIADKGDIKIFFDNLINRPANLPKGIVLPNAIDGLVQSDGLVHWPANVLGHVTFVRRLPILKTLEGEIMAMHALQGTGNVNPRAFQAELTTLIGNAARRVTTGKSGGKLPFGATKVDIETLGPNRARIVYYDSKGKPIRRGLETNPISAYDQLEDIRNAGKPTKGEWALRVARFPTSVFRAISNDVWLFPRLAYIEGNSLSATVSLIAHDVYANKTVAENLEYLNKFGGGYQPFNETFNMLPGVEDITRTARDEWGASAIGTTAELLGRGIAAVTRSPNNPATKVLHGTSEFMKRVRDVSMGTTEIRLPNGAAVPVAEESLRLTGKRVAFERTYNNGIEESTATNLLPAFQAIPGIDPALASWAHQTITEIAKNNSKGNIIPAFIKRVGATSLKPALSTMGLPKEVLSINAQGELADLLTYANPNEIDKVLAEVDRIFMQERMRNAGALSIDSGPPKIDFTEAELAKEAGWVADTMVDDAVRAGMDEATARQGAVELATSMLKEQKATFDRLIQDLETTGNNPAVWDVVNDFFDDYMFNKNAAREIVNEAGRKASRLDTNEAWIEKYQITNKAYNDLRQQQATLAEQVRVQIQEVFGGAEYKPRHDWMDKVEKYATWDEGAFHQHRATDLGGKEDTRWEEYIQAERDMLDHFQYELTGAFQQYPSLRNFNVVRTVTERIEHDGARVAFEVAQQRKKLAIGDISKTAYQQFRNKAWRDYFDGAAVYMQTMSKIIVRNGLAKQVTSQLRWTEGDVTYELLGPAANGKWRALNMSTGQVGEEFTVGSAKEGANPFTVPKNVVEDFNSLAGKEAELDKAADAVLEQIVARAPEPQTRPTSTPVPVSTSRPTPETEMENFANLGSGVSDSLRNHYRQSVDTTGKLPDVEYNNGKPTLLAQVFERMVGSGAPRTSATFDEAQGLVGRGKDAAGVGTEFAAWRQGRTQPTPTPAPGSVGVYDAPEPTATKLQEEPVTATLLQDAPAPTGPRTISTPQRIPGSVREQLRSRRDRAAQALEQEPVVSTPEVTPTVATPEVSTTIPTPNDIRKAANEAGIATMTDKGRPTDKHLLNSLNKRMGTTAKKLDDLSEAERLRAVQVLAQRTEEQLSRMSPAEVKAVAPAPASNYESIYKNSAFRRAKERAETSTLDDGTVEYRVDMQLHPKETDRLRAELKRLEQEGKATYRDGGKRVYIHFKDGDTGYSFSFGTYRGTANDLQLRITDESVPANAARTPTPTPGTTANMFGDTAEDLPTISGMAARAQDKGAFVPQDATRTESMFDLRPQMGSKEPSYKPKVAKDKVTTPGNMAQSEIVALKEARKDMEKAWEKQVSSQFMTAGRKDKRGIGSLEALSRRYSSGGVVNLNLNSGEIKQFEDMYGTVVGGFPINNIDDVRSFFQQYIDLNRRIKDADVVVGSSKQFSRMKGSSILAQTKQEFIDAGFSDSEIRDLAKDADTADGRRSILDLLASIRGDTPEDMGLAAYDMTVPSISHIMGVRDAGDGYSLWQRTVAGNGAQGFPSQAEQARAVLSNLNDAERMVKANLNTLIQGQPNTLTGAQKVALVDAARDWTPHVDTVAAKSRYVGDAISDHIMKNVDAKRDMDTLLSIFMNYSYFWRTIPSTIITAAIQKPSLVNFFYEMNRAIDTENEQAQVPDRLRGYAPIPGTDKRINIGRTLRYAMGGATDYGRENPFIEVDDNDNWLERKVKPVAKYLPGLSEWVWYAMDAGDGKVDEYYGDVFNNFAPIPFVGTKVSSLYQATQGKMPAREGVMAGWGFGPNESDPHTARRTAGLIAEEEGISNTILGYANQAILNQYNGDPIEQGIDPTFLAAALELAERAVTRNAQDDLVGQMSAYWTTAAVKPWTEAEQEIDRADKAHKASMYSEQNPDGSAALRTDQKQNDASITRGDIRYEDAPGLEARIREVYNQINRLEASNPAAFDGVTNGLYKEIERLKAQLPVDPDYTPDPYYGMNPDEKVAKEQKLLASEHWDAYHAIPKGDDKRAQYLRDNPDFVPIYDANEVKQGREVNHWWEEEDSKTSKAGSKGSKTLGGSTTPAEGTGSGLEPGSVSRDDFTEAQLDQLFDAYGTYSDNKDWDGQKAWLQENPEFARYYADITLNKYGEYPWWYDDVMGAAGTGAAGLQRPPSQPNSVADVLRRPYDAPGTGDNKVVGKGGKGSADMGGGGDYTPNQWSDDWDAYRNSGNKRQYLLDHPAFADEYMRFVRSKDPNATAWWLEGSSYSKRYGRGGGYGGGDYTPGAWSKEWDAYGALGEDWAAKKKFMLDNPEFAKYYKDRYGNAWWEQEDRVRAAFTPYSRAGNSPYLGGGGGGGGGSGGGYSGYTPQVNPRFMSRELEVPVGQQDRPWIPYSQPTPDWVRAGDRLQPEPIRRWQPPKWR